MAKSIKCFIIVNTRWGYEMQPHHCNSIAEAIKYAQGMGFAYRIFDAKTNKLIKRGYC